MTAPTSRTALRPIRARGINGTGCCSCGSGRTGSGTGRIRTWRRLSTGASTALLNHHSNPEFDLWNLVIDHDLSRPSGEHVAHARLAGCGHATEATWMIMYEAVRRNDRQALFDRAAAASSSGMSDVSRDDVYGGVFNDLLDVDGNRWQLGQDFLGAGVRPHRVARRRRRALQAGNGRRRCSPSSSSTSRRNAASSAGASPTSSTAPTARSRPCPRPERKDIYHHPRYLMLCLEALERLVGRGGKTSGVFG